VVGIPALPATSSMMDGIGGCHLVFGGGEAAVKQDKLLSRSSSRWRRTGYDCAACSPTWRTSGRRSSGFAGDYRGSKANDSTWRFVLNREIRAYPRPAVCGGLDRGDRVIENHCVMTP
jgi:hypothetical protein